MGVESLEVVLQPRQLVYFPGQTLQGFINVVVSTAGVSCTGIQVTYKGKGYVLWTESRGKSTHTFLAKESFFKEEGTVWNGADANNTLGPGHHSIPFTFKLPNVLPSSLEGKHGYVRYHVMAVVKRPGFALNKSARVTFSVNNILNLNELPVAKKPLQAEKDKTACCLCCASGPIHLSLEAQRIGYVPGEDIVVYGEVVNHSNSSVKSTELKLIQIITYHVKKHEKVEVQTLHQQYRSKIRPGGREEWSGVRIRVPPLPDSLLCYCSCIDVNHFVELRANLGICRSTYLLAQVVIGTVPLEGTIENSNQGFQPMGSVFTPQDYQSSAPFAWDVPDTAPKPDDDDDEEPYDFRNLPVHLYGTYSVFKSRNASPTPAHPQLRKGKAGTFTPQYVTYKEAKTT